MLRFFSSSSFSSLFKIMLFIFVRIIPYPPVLFTSAVGINPTRKAAAPIFLIFFSILLLCLPGCLQISQSLSLSHTLFVAVDFSSSSSLLLCLIPFFFF